MKVGICVPWDTPFIWTQAVFTIMNIEAPEGWTKQYFRGEGWCPAQRHNTCVAKAMNWGADYILILGADQMFEPDTLIRMAAHLEEWDMVSGLVPSRGYIERHGKAFGAYGYKFKDGVTGNPDVDSDDVWDFVGPEEGSQQIDSIGTGILLLPAHVFDTLMQPWFTEYIVPQPYFGRRTIMDTQFVKKCTQVLGLRLYLDVDIKSKHLDIFQIDETYSDRFSDVTRPNWVPAMGDDDGTAG